MELIRLPGPDSAPIEGEGQAGRRLLQRLGAFEHLLRHRLAPGGGRTLVDLGTGHGLFARLAARHGFAVTAVDAREPWSLRIAGDASSHATVATVLPREIPFVQADVREFDLSGFDVVLAIGFIYHLPLHDQIGLLHRARGKIVVIDTEVFIAELVPPCSRLAGRAAEPVAGFEGVLVEETGHVWSAVGNDRSFWHTEPSLRHLFDDAGFARALMLDPPYRSAFGARRWYVLEPLLALHIRRRSLGDVDHASLAARIDAFAREHALLPMLISIGPSLFDSGLLRDIADRMTGPHVLLDDPLGLREIAAAIAHAALYVGASFHGYVTAAAYDVPGVMVARPALRKFSGFLRQTGRTGDLARDWTAGFGLAAQALAQPRATRIPAAVLAAADAHWEAILGAIADPARRAAERQRFLRSCLRWGVERAGPGWLVQPFLTRASRHADWRSG